MDLADLFRRLKAIDAHMEDVRVGDQMRTELAAPSCPVNARNGADIVACTEFKRAIGNIKVDARCAYCHKDLVPVRRAMAGGRAVGM